MSEIYNVSSDGIVDMMDINYTTIGGTPCWFKGTRPSISLNCKVCGRKLILIGQFNAPLLGHIHIPHRCIYVFGCNSDHFNRSVIVIRGQGERKENIHEDETMNKNCDKERSYPGPPSMDTPSYMSPPTMSDPEVTKKEAIEPPSADQLGMDLLGALKKAVDIKTKAISDLKKGKGDEAGGKNQKSGKNINTVAKSEEENSDEDCNDDETYISEWSEGERIPDSLPAFAVKITDADTTGESFVYKDMKEAIDESEPDENGTTPEEARYQHALHEVKGLLARYGLGMFPVLPCPIKLKNDLCPYCHGPTHIELEIFSPLIFITEADKYHRGKEAMEFCAIVVRTCKNSCDVKKYTKHIKSSKKGGTQNYWMYCPEDVTVITEEMAFSKGTQEM